MFSLFKANNPGVVIFYLLYVVGFRLLALNEELSVDFAFAHAEPISKVLFGWLAWLPVRMDVLLLVLGGAFSFLQAVLVNDIINQNKLLVRRSYLGGAVFLLLVSMFRDSLFFSPVSLALTLLLLMVRHLFSLIRQEKANGVVFDLGFLTALLLLIYFPCAPLVLFAFIGLGMLRSFAYREWTIVLFGFIAPLFVVFAIYVWNDRLPQMPLEIFGGLQMKTVHVFSLRQYDWILLGSFLLLLLGSLVMLPGVLYSSLIQVRKFSTVLLLLLVFLGCSFFLQGSMSLAHLQLLALPVGILFTLVLTGVDNRVVTEGIHALLIILILAAQILPKFVPVIF